LQVLKLNYFIVKLFTVCIWCPWCQYILDNLVTPNIPILSVSYYQREFIKNS